MWPLGPEERLFIGSVFKAGKTWVCDWAAERKYTRTLRVSQARNARARGNNSESPPGYSVWLRDHSQSARSIVRSGVGAGSSLCGLTMLLSARRLQKARYSS